MKAREYLGRFRLLDAKVGLFAKEIEAVRQSAVLPGCAGNSDEKVQVSCTAEQMADTVAKYIDMEIELTSRIRCYECQRRKAADEIMRLENEKHAALLYSRYMEFKSFQAIADKMGYSYGYIRRVHKEALDAFSDKYLKKKKW